MKLKMMLLMITIVCVLSACKADERIKLVNSGENERTIAYEENQFTVHITEEMNEAISNYVIQKYSSVYSHLEKQFEVHNVYGASETNGIFTVYLYSYFGGYNKFSGLENQAGHSLPAVIRLQKKAEGYAVIEYTEPKDGSLYQSSLKQMFPEKYLKMMYEDAGTTEKLQIEMDKKVKRWLDAERVR
ncbi:hypothetical protein AB4Z29_21000 [Paenibacillus sp. 2TAB23]|uniref:hypothetical protein n=1 Tax=Paenibacillus sp. 2TAB23 TaxID=3233004 RepID=UPI003F98D981